MRLEQLHYFAEIARCRSIRRASSLLFITQQSLSQSMKNLERELDVSLLRRSADGVFLTDEGKAFLSFAKSVLQEEAILKRKWEEIRSVREMEMLEGTLNIYAFGVYDYHLLPEILDHFRRQHPRVKVRTWPADFLTIQNVFMSHPDENSVGLIVIPESGGQAVRNWIAEKGLSFGALEKSRYLLCCSSSSELCRKKTADLNDLKSRPMIYFGSNGISSGGIFEILRHYGWEDVSACLETQSIPIWQSSIASGNCIGFLHEYIYDYLSQTPSFEKASIAVVSLKQTLGNISGFVAPPHPAPAAKSFIRLMRSFAAVSSENDK